MKNYLLLIILTLFFYYSQAQNFADKKFYLVDSLELTELSQQDQDLLKESLNLYHKSNTDTGKINALSNICENMIHQSWEKYQFLQYNLIKSALNKNNSELETKSLKISLAHAVNNIGVIYVLEGKVMLGLENFETSLKLKEELKDSLGMADALNNIGIFYYGQGDVPLAIDYYERSLKVREKMNDEKGMALSYESLGITHKDQDNLNLALKYYNMALELHKKNENKQGIAQMHNNIGVIYKISGDFENALKSYEKSLELREEIQDKRGMAESLTNMAHIKQEENDLNSAMLLYQKSLALREEVNDQRSLAFSYNDIGEVYLKQGNYKSAESFGLQGLNLSKQLQAPKLIQRNANLLCLVFEKQGKGLQALEMNRLSEQMKDSLNNLETQRASIQQQTKYKYDKAKAIRDINHKSQLKLERENTSKQKIISYSIGIGLLLVALMLFIVFNRLKVTSKQKRVIEEQKLIVEEKNKEITDSITYAKRIQEAILPTTKLVKKWLPNSFIFYKPKDIVAGDFYWMDVKDQYILYAAADCTGHGVPGAMVSVVCHNALNRVIKDDDVTDPGKILDRTRELIENQLNSKEVIEDISYSYVRDGMDIALCVLNTEDNTIRFSGANNPLWILRTGQTEMEEIKGTRQAIGKVSNPVPFQTHEIKLNEGDLIYVFSDGLADQFGGERGKKLKYKPFKEMLISIRDESMENQLELLRSEFNNWKGDLEQVDDVCVIGIRI